MLVVASLLQVMGLRMAKQVLQSTGHTKVKASLCGRPTSIDDVCAAAASFQGVRALVACDGLHCEGQCTVLACIVLHQLTACCHL